MTALSIDMTTADRVHTWGRLTSGHQRPAKVHDADHDRIDAWADYTAICDLFEEGKVTLDIVLNAKEVAQYMDAEYRRLYKVWQTSLGDCECRMIDADREYVCAACRARVELTGEKEMPY